MALTHKFTILCDEVRMENTGKYIIIGMYTPDMTVPAIPFAVPALTFFCCLESDGPMNADINFRLSQGNNLLAGGSGKAGVARAGMVILPLRIGPIQFPSAGTCTFTLEVVGQAEPFSSAFDVTLAVQGQPQAPVPHGVH